MSHSRPRKILLKYKIIFQEESEEKKQKRLEKEVRNMRNKIRYLKEKQDHMKRERMGFKMSLKNQQAALKLVVLLTQVCNLS